MRKDFSKEEMKIFDQVEMDFQPSNIDEYHFTLKYFNDIHDRYKVMAVDKKTSTWPAVSVKKWKQSLMSMGAINPVKSTKVGHKYLDLIENFQNNNARLLPNPNKFMML